jgi:DnaJ-class molecular chaperone
MLYINTKCENCDGHGTYCVLNAYDPDFKETIICEVCHGSGKVARALNTKEDIDKNN